MYAVRLLIRWSPTILLHRSLHIRAVYMYPLLEGSSNVVMITVLLHTRGVSIVSIFCMLVGGDGDGDGAFQGGGDGAQPRGGACAGYERQYGARLRLPRDGVEHLVRSDDGAQRQVSNKSKYNQTRSNPEGIIVATFLMLQMREQTLWQRFSPVRNSLD